MATHITSIRSSGILAVTKAEFYDQLRFGDMVLCQGKYAESDVIEACTSSPFSHILMVWLPAGATQWLTLESTASKGVHVGRLSDYVDLYDGDLVLVRRSILTDADKLAELNAGFALLDDTYDWQQEVTTVAHKLLHALPIDKPAKEYYCSGLMYAISLATSHPLQMPGPSLPTPEDNYTDATVAPVCALLKAAA
jgi:hypothetical protein